MQIVHYCSKCHFITTGDSARSIFCPNCGVKLISLGVTLEQWNASTEDEMRAIIDRATTTQIKQPTISPQNRSASTNNGMRRLTCEMCGSIDLVKQNGLFVCQNCGTKYSVEEARKMMIDGKVDVSGSRVKIDTTDELSNLYQIARRAKQEENCDNAARYYDMILIKDPSSWEASFYVVYFKAMQCKIAEIRTAAVSIFNCLSTVFDLIVRNEKEPDKQVMAIQEITARCVMAASTLFNAAINPLQKDDTNIKESAEKEILNTCRVPRDILYALGDRIEATFANRVEFQTACTNAWKNAIALHAGVMPYLDFFEKRREKKIIDQYANKIRKYEPYKPPRTWFL